MKKRKKRKHVKKNEDALAKMGVVKKKEKETNEGEKRKVEKGKRM